MNTNLFWNSEEKTIRGSFINMSLTIIIAILIIAGVFNKEVCNNLKESQSLITWFFGLSWGIYGAKSVADTYITNK